MDLYNLSIKYLSLVTIVFFIVSKVASAYFAAPAL